jgi:hypothetical protein
VSRTENNITCLVAICIIWTILGCAGQSYERKLAVKYKTDVEALESWLKERHSEYIKFEIAPQFPYSVRSVAYFIYPNNDGKYELLKISGQFRYKPLDVHIDNWKYYTTILTKLTTYDCFNAYDGTPQSHDRYFEIIYHINDASITSRIYENEWRTVDDGAFSNDHIRSVESRFIHRFIMDTYETDFRDLNYPYPAIK